MVVIGQLVFLNGIFSSNTADGVGHVAKFNITERNFIQLFKYLLIFDGSVVGHGFNQVFISFLSIKA
ncbi:hypothetical protein SDC9_127291 [bioreactor metagenome]|uniref:Uncharacterized protein n=1 Tax=bioreactor metagenome TaxID=1076179 RepID=A0A645CTL1_9ZZZZ